ncbi:MAG: aminotransferase class I/II-fold pyridoxal phosphate-dependent enzyme, partial [Candidatus Omnitrophota bacterium]
DPEHLENMLKKERERFKEALIITESVFSMDGDRAPLKELVELKEEYGCRMMVDEAHATGIFGARGSGLVEEDGLEERVDLVMGTFGKALGGFGAYLASTKEVIEYLINFCRSFIYSTALPPSTVAVDRASVEIIKEEPWRRKVLLENAAYLRGELSRSGLKVGGSSQIIPLIVGDKEAAEGLSGSLKNAGYWALPIRPPTVPEGGSRIRLSLTYNHTKDILKGLADEIRAFYE